MSKKRKKKSKKRKKNRTPKGRNQVKILKFRSKTMLKRSLNLKIRWIKQSRMKGIRKWKYLIILMLIK